MNRKHKTAAAKPEVLVSRVLMWIETKFEMLFLFVSDVGQTDEFKSDIVRHRLTLKTQGGNRQTGNTRISRFLTDRNEIRNILSMFSISARPINKQSDSRRHRPSPETQDTNISGLAAAILRFRCRSMSAEVKMVLSVRPTSKT
jgi:hypothetical protein